MSLQVQQRESLKAAGILARDVAKIVKDNGLSRSFGKGGREHVYIEGWLTISRVNNEQPHAEVKGVHKDPETGIEVIHARAFLTDAKGMVVSEADGYCSSEEGNWAGKPFYARASMAQTRALGKAMRLRHAWVMVMAGFAPTPAEEMDGIELEPVTKPVKTAHTNAVRTTQMPQEPVQVETRANGSSKAKSEPLETPVGDGAPENDYPTECVKVAMVSKFPPKTGTRPNGTSWWRSMVRVEVAGQLVDVTCWSEDLFNKLRANNGKKVLLTYKIEEPYNGKPQWSAHDVKEVNQ